MKRVKRAKKVSKTQHAIRKKKTHVRKASHKPSRQIFVQRELFEQPLVKEEAKTTEKPKFWIYALVVIIILILIVFLFRFFSGLKSSSESQKSSSIVPSATVVVTQQAIQEKVVIEKSEPPIIKQEKTVTIYFASNKWEVNDLSVKEKNKLNALIEELLKEKSMQEFFIYGYADRTGLRSYNLVVSENRARNIAEFLSKKVGFPLDKIVVQGKGEVLEGPDGVNNPLFRKVEIIIK